LVLEDLLTVRDRLTPAGLTGLVLRNFVLFVLVALAAALVAAALAGVLPQRFTSTAYLQIDEASARAADALMSSEPVLDKVLTKIPVPGDTIEERRRRLDSERTITVARNEIARSSRLFRLDVIDSNPIGARAANIAFIEAWLEASRPNPLKREQLEAAIKRAEEEIKATSLAIERLQNTPHPDLSSENSLQGNPATPLVSLLSKRDQAFDILTGLKGELTGIARESVLLGEPTLPEEPTWPRRSWVAMIGAAAGVVLLFLVLLFRVARR
jgi:hypothetical protein